MLYTTNLIIKNPETKTFVADTFQPNNIEKLPLVIFMHGYKGYKDWGAWNLMCKSIAKAGYFVVAFNTSYNGTSTEKQNEFSQLDDFGNNNYSKELSDLRHTIDFFSKNENVNSEKIAIIGHSRGGGLSIIEASENINVKNLITLAAISNLNRFPKGDKFQEWKEKGVYYVVNGRTQQKMPHKFQFFEDFNENRERFSIEKACKNLIIPHLIIHGTDDKAVDFSNAEQLKKWSTKSELITIKNANHTFNTKEPWEQEIMSPELKKVSIELINFLNKNL